MVVRSWRVNIVQGLHYSVESYVIAYPRMHPHTLTCQRAPWQLRYTSVFDPKPSRNSSCPPATLSSLLRPQNMPRTWYQTCKKHGIKPSSHSVSLSRLPPKILLLLSYIYIYIYIYKLKVGPTCLLVPLGPFQLRNNLFRSGFSSIYLK